MTSQLYGLAPKDLLWGAKINNPELHRVQQAKSDHRHFLPRQAQRRTNPRRVLNASLWSEMLSYGAVVKPPGEATHH